MSENKVIKRLMQDFGIILIGLALLICCSLISPVTAIFCFIFSIGALFYGLADFGLIFRKLKSTVEDLKEDKAGLAWVWIVGFGLTFPFCAVVYWALDYPFDLICNVALGVYTFEGTMAYAWDTSRLVISYLLVFVVIFTILWVIQNSKAHVYGV